MRLKNGKRMLSLGLTLLLAGCSQIHWRTNIGEYTTNLAHRGSVDEITLEQIKHYQPDPLGRVTAVQCQDSRHKLPPSRRAVVETLKVKASKKGANAIHVEGCSDSPASPCYSAMTCSAYAYRVEYGTGM